MSKSSKILKKDIEKFISLRKLFPRSTPDFRRGLTKYQTKKIKKAIQTVKNISGGNLFEFVKIKSGSKNYMRDHNLPSYMKGIFLPGGENKNKNVNYKDGELSYIRGETKRSRFQIDTESEETVIISCKQILKNKKRRRANITANGRVIGSALNLSNDALISEAVYIFNKYEQAFLNHETRFIKDKRTGQLKEVLAAHPSTWCMGVLFEPAGAENNGKKKTKERKRPKGI